MRAARYLWEDQSGSQDLQPQEHCIANGYTALGLVSLTSVLCSEERKRSELRIDCVIGVMETGAGFEPA
jgi:hypothetical protein